LSRGGKNSVWWRVRVLESTSLDLKDKEDRNRKRGKKGSPGRKGIFLVGRKTGSAMGSPLGGGRVEKRGSKERGTVTLSGEKWGGQSSTDKNQREVLQTGLG